MDDADRAEEYQEVALAAAIEAARGVKPDPRTTCRECADHLPAHRQPVGICVPCQARIEARTRRLG